MKNFKLGSFRSWPIVLAAFIISIGSAALAAEISTVDLDIAPPSSTQNRLHITADASYYYFNDSDDAWVNMYGDILTKLRVDYDPQTCEVSSVSGIDFVGGVFEFSTFGMEFLNLLDVTGEGIGGRFYTPVSPGQVSGTAFLASDHNVLLNRGRFVASGAYNETINLAYYPVRSPVNNGSATGSINVGLSDVVVEGYTATCTYDVDLTIPFDVETNIPVDDSVEVDLTVTGNCVASGQYQRYVSITPPEVTLGLVDNGCPVDGLRSYTLTATGPGITKLSQFTVDGDVHQVFNAGEPSEWLGDGSASASETTDSYVIFGDSRVPNLDGQTWPGPGEQPDHFTEETITGGGDSGMGTLNNYDEATGFSDDYIDSNPPSEYSETIALMQLVVENGGGFSVNLELGTATAFSPAPGGYIDGTHSLSFSLATAGCYGDANRDGYVNQTDLEILSKHWLQSGGWAGGDFDGNGIVDDGDLAMLVTNLSLDSVVPEPGTWVLLVGLLLPAILLRRKRRK